MISKRATSMLARIRFAVAVGSTLSLLAGLSLAAGAAAAPRTSVMAVPVSSRTAGDPGSKPWAQVPRDRVAAECGMDPLLLERASVEMAQTPFTVVRYGKLCWTGGYPSGAAGPYAVHSITKTLGAVLLGMIASRSELDDTDPVTDWIPPGELGAINRKATIAHVLAMTSTKPDLRPGRKGAWSYDTLGDREINKLVGVMNRAIAREPTAFPGVTDVKQFAEKELFGPLGMRSSSWPGQVIGFSMISSPEDMARLGLLLLRKGRWQGRQLLDEQYAYRMTHPAFEDTNTGYGYLTQMNAASGWTYSSGTPDLACSPYATWTVYPHAPFFQSKDDNGGSPFGPARHDIGLAWAAGAGGQKISVQRGLDLVITIRDDAASQEDGKPVTFEGHKRPWRLIRPALVKLDPVYKGDEPSFCAAYQRSVYAPDLLSPWSTNASGPPRRTEASTPSDALGTGTTPDSGNARGDEPPRSSATARDLAATGPRIGLAIAALAILMSSALLRRVTPSAAGLH